MPNSADSLRWGAPAARRFCLELTECGQGGNPVLATVHLMDVTDLNFRQGMGVRPGESDPAAMLGGVLLLVVIVPLAALALVWWLA